MANVKVIYSVLLGDYDNFFPAPKYLGWDYVVFTDNAKLDADGWQIKVVNGGRDTQKESRKYKLLSHLYLSEYDLVCYVDANVSLVAEPPAVPIWFSHAKIDKVFDKAEQVIKQGKATEEQVSRQMRYYLERLFPDKGGLYDNKFFVRDNRNEVQNSLMQHTWNIISEYTNRDELALPFAMWSLQYKMQNITPYSVATKFISVQPHKITPKFKKAVMVHHITPGRADKNIGKAINTIIAGLPDDDWICLRDIDTLPMYHEKIYQQCEDIASVGEFDLVGCMTNRLGLHYQLINGEKSNNSDIMYHRKLAVDLYNKHTNDIMVMNQVIGGLFMLFSKKTWQTVGGFVEGGIQIKGHFFDYYFCKAVIRNRLRIGIAKGIYLFHYYRFESGQDTRKSIAHLL